MNKNGKPAGYLTFTLHSHLPYVVNHGTWPHGMEWLHEAAAETYLPLLRALKRLEKLNAKKNECKENEDKEMDERDNADDGEIDLENESDDEKENESDEDEKENEDDKEEKSNSKDHFKEMKNAHLKNSGAIVLETSMSKLQRGQSRYGSAR